MPPRLRITRDQQIAALEGKVELLEQKLDNLAEYTGALTRETLNGREPGDFVGLVWRDGEWKLPGHGAAAQERERQLAVWRAEAMRR